MKIEIIKKNKKDFLDLLLLADEQENMIDKYIERGIMFAIYDNDLKGVCIVTKEEDRVYEIKNIAIYENFHGQGYGKKLIEYICEYFKGDCDIIYVGTGDSPLTVPFYEKCGFKKSHRIKNFFIENYDNPIYECGKQLIDMIYLKKEV
ncbi:GNAT family N-acetyltransferase [Clostridium sp.]|jgi:ribosomal protein S18 acetylase RimI-like enzyme|uniref:GNAT family N-acetyltransferase n=1 Tax=Clostridium sp. TaxID=1506 RepID=UPI0025BD5A95|nr:GNAT family N-acetyltransferase [Clostridium sp.]MCI9070797.1 GNAT family N-acetyltransferase [Clostridium sp.]